MRKYVTMLASSAIIIGGSYALFNYVTASGESDDIVAALPGYLVPLDPPTSGSPGLGVLYFVKSDLRGMYKICEPPKELVDQYTSVSNSANVSGALDHQATYSSKIQQVIAKLFGGSGSFTDRRSDKLNYEFSDVRLYNIEIGAAKRLYDKMMEREDCKSAVTTYQGVSGYICQGLEVFQATGSLWFDSQNSAVASLDANAKKAVVASVIRGGTNVALNEQEGKYTTGKAMQWGIQMTPVCLTPPWARSLHTFPQTKMERIQNFIQFNMVERIFPATDTKS